MRKIARFIKLFKQSFAFRKRSFEKSVIAQVWEVKGLPLPKAFVVIKSTHYVDHGYSQPLTCIIQQGERFEQIIDNPLFYSRGADIMDFRHLMARPDLFQPLLTQEEIFRAKLNAFNTADQSEKVQNFIANLKTKPKLLL